MRYILLLSLGLLGLMSGVSLTALAGENGWMYEHQNYRYSPSTGSAFTLKLHSIALQDSTGTMSSALAGVVNQELSHEKAAQDIWLGQSRDSTFSYAWEQSHPIVNKGDLYRFFWSSEGHASQTWTRKYTDPTPALWGFEIRQQFWSIERVPISYALGWGVLHYHVRSNYLNPAPSANKYQGSGYDYTSTSFPLDITTTFHPLDTLALYADFALSPINIMRNQPRYSHFEGGAIWTLGKTIKLKTSFRQVRDYLSDDPSSKNAYKLDYKTSIFSLGAGMYF